MTTKSHKNESKNDKKEILKAQTLNPIDSNIPLAKTSRMERHYPVAINPPMQVLHQKRLQTKLLDGFLLLEATHMAFPEDSRQAVISDQSFTGVVEDDLAFFSGLRNIDACNNYFDLTAFQTLERLKELRLACNNIRYISGINGFPRLQYLDLSYNILTIDAVSNLVLLPNLRELDISGNNLTYLPENISQFRLLEKLICENNKFEDNNIFFLLSSIPQLRCLNIACNMLSNIASECCEEGNFRYFYNYF